MLAVNKKIGIKRKPVTLLTSLDVGMQKERLERWNLMACTSKEMWFLRELGEGMILEILMRNGQPFASSPTSRLVVCQLWKQKQEGCRANCFL